MVDYALRRRFAFMDLKPQFGSDKFSGYLESCGLDEAVINKVCSRMLALNEKIAGDNRDLGPGFCIGHSFFCSSRDGLNSEDWYQEILENEIEPLLREYWADNPDEAENQLRALRDG